MEVCFGVVLVSEDSRTKHPGEMKLGSVGTEEGSVWLTLQVKRGSIKECLTEFENGRFVEDDEDRLSFEVNLKDIFYASQALLNRREAE